MAKKICCCRLNMIDNSVVSSLVKIKWVQTASVMLVGIPVVPPSYHAEVSSHCLIVWDCAVNNIKHLPMWMWGSFKMPQPQTKSCQLKKTNMMIHRQVLEIYLYLLGFFRQVILNLKICVLCLCSNWTPRRMITILIYWLLSPHAVSLPLRSPPHSLNISDLLLTRNCFQVWHHNGCSLQSSASYSAGLFHCKLGN